MNSTKNIVSSHLHDTLMPESNWSVIESSQDNVYKYTPFAAYFSVVVTSCVFCIVVAIVLATLQNISGSLSTEIRQYAHQHKDLISCFYCLSFIVPTIRVFYEPFLYCIKHDDGQRTEILKYDGQRLEYDKNQGRLEDIFVIRAFLHILASFILAIIGSIIFHNL